MEDLQENNLSELKKRLEEIELTLNSLSELIESRNHLLTCFEKRILKKISQNKFSSLNISTRGNKYSATYVIKKNYELDLKMCRRGQFFLERRRRKLEEELNEIKEKIESLSA